MTPITNPHNATPQKLQLKPPKIPRLPFSSPMGEEILSPTSDPSHTPPQEQKEHKTPPALRMAGHATPPPPSLAERRFSAPRSQKRDSRKDSPNRGKWPGLNVITDFSRGLDHLAGVSKAQTVQKPHIQPFRLHEKRSMTEPIAKPAVESRKNSEESVRSRQDQRLGHRRSGKSLKGSGSKGRLDDLKRSSTKSSNLSPSDRAVMIGIAMNPDEVVPNVSPGDENYLGSVNSTHARRPSLTPSIAPSIIITPADPSKEAPWSNSDKAATSPPHRRAVSSVYSRAPGPGDIENGASMVPPVPPIPAGAVRDGEYTAYSKGPTPRAVSTYTIFDEEPSPEAAAQSRPASRESQLHMLDKINSQDTSAGKRRSDGWWTYIKSPFFPKSPMFLKNQGGTQNDDQPPVPHNGRLEPPVSPLHHRKSQAAESVHTSWTDSSVDIEDEKRAIEFGGPLQTTRDLDHSGPVRMPRESFHILQGFRGQGAATEYYEACLHDMRSTLPYFECQNHKCWPSTFGIGGYVNRGIDGPQAPPAARGLALTPLNTNSDKKVSEIGKPLATSQMPSNRFSAAFGEVTDKSESRAKHLTDVTIIEDGDATPAVEEAKAAPILKANPPRAAMTPPVRKDSLARQASTIHSSPFYTKPDPQPKVLPTPPPRLPEKNSPKSETIRETPTGTPKRGVVSGLPSNPRHKTVEQPLSPPPPTPGPSTHAPVGAIPLHEVTETREIGPPPPPVQHTYITNHYYHGQSKRSSHVSETTVRDLWPPPRPPRPAESLGSWHTKEVYEPPPKKPIKEKTFNFDHYKKCLQRKPVTKHRKAQSPEKKKKKRIIMIIAVGLLLLVILIVVLAMTLTRHGDNMPAQSQWLNITGYPPIPTGISTIAQPNAAYEESGCVQPQSLWSCALPKEDQKGVTPNKPDQPNFRVEIRFQNGTNASQIASRDLTPRTLRPTNAVSAGQFVRTKMLQVRSAFTNSLFTSNPAPPSREDQTFLGNTTDKNQAPFDGEFTPFYMTFQSPAPLTHRLAKRQSSSSSSSSNNNNSFPDIASVIPTPSTNPDGTASPANLYPYPSAQPLRLFNRGRPDEHYGFYTYFSRSIFLSSIAPLNASLITGNTPTDPADADGGSTQATASVRCTWTETRFLVQIWTNKGSNLQLLNNTSPSPNNNNKKGNTTAFSANDFARPGSFPYPVSISLDRHGGDIQKKMIYCYGLDNNTKPIPDAKKLQLEDREFGGQLVNGAKGPWKDVKVRTEDGGPGGVDGGSGGCGCRWENFGK